MANAKSKTSAELAAVRVEFEALPPDVLPRPRPGQVVEMPPRERLPKPEEVCAAGHGAFYGIYRRDGAPVCPVCLKASIAEGTARLENPEAVSDVIAELRRRTRMLDRYVPPTPHERRMREVMGMTSPLDDAPPGPCEVAEAYRAPATAHYARWRGEAIRKVADLAGLGAGDSVVPGAAPVLVTAEALCEALGVSDRTLRRWDGLKLPRSVQVQGVRYWNAFAVLQWLGAFNGRAGEVRFAA